MLVHKHNVGNSLFFFGLAHNTVKRQQKRLLEETGRNGRVRGKKKMKKGVFVIGNGYFANALLLQASRKLCRLLRPLEQGVLTQWRRKLCIPTTVDKKMQKKKPGTKGQNCKSVGKSRENEETSYRAPPPVGAGRCGGSRSETKTGRVSSYKLRVLVRRRRPRQDGSRMKCQTCIVGRRRSVPGSLMYEKTVIFVKILRKMAFLSQNTKNARKTGQ